MRYRQPDRYLYKLFRNRIAGDRSKEMMTKNILAVIVLYKRKAEESEAYLAFRELLKENNTAAFIELMLCDNTPTVQSPPAEFTGTYLSDTSNSGLAKHYNAALKIAEERGIPWLMLFDQDTTPTAEYLGEIIEKVPTWTNDSSIVAVVPKLHNGKTICSPHGAPTWAHPSFPADQQGTSESVLFAFNSGAVLRVEALQHIGGFPEEFWLDFLDHATFIQLQRAGGSVFVMKSLLRHQLAISDTRTSVSPARYQNILRSERSFYGKYGTKKDRFYLKIRLFKTTLRFLIKEWRPQLARLTFRSFLGKVEAR